MGDNPSKWKCTDQVATDKVLEVYDVCHLGARNHSQKATLADALAKATATAKEAEAQCKAAKMESKISSNLEQMVIGGKEALH